LLARELASSLNHPVLKKMLLKETKAHPSPNVQSPKQVTLNLSLFITLVNFYCFAGEGEGVNQADKAEPTADSQGTEEKESSVEKPTESVPNDQGSAEKTAEDKTDPPIEQKTSEEQKETEEQKEAPTQPPESEEKLPAIIEDTTTEAPASSEVPKEEGKEEVTKEDTKDEQPKEEPPKDQEQPQEDAN